jgi:hypothetical protein
VQLDHHNLRLSFNLITVLTEYLANSLLVSTMKFSPFPVAVAALGIGK